MRLLLTCPGKLGDLVYALPLVRLLARELAGRPGDEVHLLTARRSAAALPLLRAQPYVSGAELDPAYQPRDESLGVQPWRMSEPPGFDQVLHLGLRPELVGARDIFSRPLPLSFALNLRLAYGLDLRPDPAQAWLTVPAPEPGERVLFQGAGQTFNRLLDPALARHLAAFWPALFQALGRPVVGLGAPGEKAWYQGLGLALLTPPDLLAAARLIAGAPWFVGVESVGAALANGLDAPRLILDYFGNALPATARGLAFRADESPRDVAARARSLWKGETHAP
ncbi:MAG: hypothetical protein KQJ78_09415 [Deltaproteobacteria bacterium]|nr:hypothetical protein [Deltaproteobacteria bacterium]